MNGIADTLDLQLVAHSIREDKAESDVIRGGGVNIYFLVFVVYALSLYFDALSLFFRPFRAVPRV